MRSDWDQRHAHLLGASCQVVEHVLAVALIEWVLALKGESVTGWVKVLVFVFFGGFAFLAVILAAHGDFKAAAGAMVPAALLSPALLEVLRPGRYLLRKPTDGSPDNLMYRLKQFRLDHPGIDGTLILGVFVVLALAFLVSAVVRLVNTLL